MSDAMVEDRHVPPSGPAGAWPSGSETILLAEDEPAVRAVAARTLRSLGYRVIEAVHGRQALEVARGHGGPLHLLVTDLVMPHLDGPALAAELRCDRPEIRILFTSGYPPDVLSGMTRGEVATLSKPYDPEALARRVRQLLDEAPDERARQATCASGSVIS